MSLPNTRLRYERQQRGWSQDYLAQQIGVPDYYISRWERGKVVPSPYYRQKLCELFDKTAEALGFLPNDVAEQTRQEAERFFSLMPPPHPPMEMTMISPQEASMRKPRSYAWISLTLLIVLLFALIGTVRRCYT